MSRAMAPADWHARAEAYHEAAEHLKLAWTEERKEREQCDIVSKLLQREADKCHRIADEADRPATMHGVTSAPRNS